jgi:hypothetical protein
MDPGFRRDDRGFFDSASKAASQLITQTVQKKAAQKGRLS